MLVHLQLWILANAYTDRDIVSANAAGFNSAVSGAVVISAQIVLTLLGLDLILTLTLLGWLVFRVERVDTNVTDIKVNYVRKEDLPMYMHKVLADKRHGTV